MRMTQGGVLTALHNGDVIMKTIINDPPSSAGVFWRLMKSGATVRSDLVARLLADGLIRERRDGLDLIGASSQTYELAPVNELDA